MVGSSHAPVKENRLQASTADRVADRYFTNYSGITYLEEVEVLRERKFHKLPDDTNT